MYSHFESNNLSTTIRRAVGQLTPTAIKVPVHKLTFDFANAWRLYIMRQVPILIFQMGKVGSSSILTSLLEHGLPFTIHVHRLNPKNIDARAETVDNVLQASHLDSERWIYQNITQSDKPVKYITLVRDPLGRAMSHYFENLSYITGIENAETAIALQELQAMFVEKYLWEIIAKDWFDDELKPVSGINVYETPFDTETGYSIYQRDNTEVLLLKLEISDEDKEKAIADFVGEPDFKLKRANDTSQKSYAELYRVFRNTIVFPQRVLDKVYSMKMAQHFYTEEEIQYYMKKWQRSA